MKKILGLMILFLIFSSFVVVAGEILKPDFSKKDQYLVGLKEGDMAEFYLNGERNIIIVRMIKPDSVDITAFVAQETNGYPYYTTLSKNKTLKMDVERDDVDDLFVGFYESDENLEYVYLLMQKPSTNPTGWVVDDKIEREKREFDKYIIGGFIFVVGLLVFLMLKSKNEE